MNNDRRIIIEDLYNFGAKKEQEKKECKRNKQIMLLSYNNKIKLLLCSSNYIVA